MLDLKTTVIVYLIIIGCCLVITIGGYFGKKLEVFRVAIGAGIIALAAIILFAIYAAYYLLTHQS